MYDIFDLGLSQEEEPKQSKATEEEQQSKGIDMEEALDKGNKLADEKLKELPKQSKIKAKQIRALRKPKQSKSQEIDGDTIIKTANLFKEDKWKAYDRLKKLSPEQIAEIKEKGVSTFWDKVGDFFSFAGADNLDIINKSMERGKTEHDKEEKARKEIVEDIEGKAEQKKEDSPDGNKQTEESKSTEEEPEIPEEQDSSEDINNDGIPDNKEDKLAYVTFKEAQSVKLKTDNPILLDIKSKQEFKNYKNILQTLAKQSNNFTVEKLEGMPYDIIMAAYDSLKKESEKGNTTPVATPVAKKKSKGKTKSKAKETHYTSVM